MQIEGVNAIVTGAAGGIGQVMCSMLLEAGAQTVGLLDRSEARLEEVCAVLADRHSPERIVRLLADVRDAGEVREAIGRFGDVAGSLQVLVNNAGVLRDGAVYAVTFRGPVVYPLEKWRETIETNLTGQFLTVQAALPLMLAKRGPHAADRERGLLVNVSSISRTGRAGQAAYSASKGGNVSLTLTLARELAAYRIRCVAIAPGLVDTPMAATIPAAYREEMLARVPVGRMGRPAEIAHALRFCVENEFFNGRVLEIDGGAD